MFFSLRNSGLLLLSISIAKIHKNTACPACLFSTLSVRSAFPQASASSFGVGMEVWPLRIREAKSLGWNDSSNIKQLAVASFASYQRHPGIIDPLQMVALCFTVSPCFTMFHHVSPIFAVRGVRTSLMLDPQDMRETAAAERIVKLYEAINISPTNCLRKAK